MYIFVIPSVLGANAYLLVYVAPAEVTQEECQRRSFFSLSCQYSTSLLRCLTWFLSREGFGGTFPSSTVRRKLCTHDIDVLNCWVFRCSHDAQERGTCISNKNGHASTRHCMGQHAAPRIPDESYSTPRNLMQMKTRLAVPAPILPLHPATAALSPNTGGHAK